MPTRLYGKQATRSKPFCTTSPDASTPTATQQELSRVAAPMTLSAGNCLLTRREEPQVLPILPFEPKGCLSGRAP